MNAAELSKALYAAKRPRGRHASHLSAAERFWSNVTFEPGGCWIFGTGRGYGRFVADTGTRHLVPAHRWAYEHLEGSIPEGLQLDHLCRNHACVNPAHLEPVTVRENLMRGRTHAARNASKTHCPQGHVYDRANTEITKGKRHCRTCRRISSHERYKARTT